MSNCSCPQTNNISANPSEIMECLFSCLAKKREQDILKKRYGLSGGALETLEKIGQNYHITRERVRQIETNILRKLRETAKEQDLIKNLVQELKNILENYGGLMEETHLADEVLKKVKQENLKTEKPHLDFLLRNILEDYFLTLAPSEKFKKLWALEQKRIKNLEQLHFWVETILKELGKPIHHNKVIDSLKKKSGFQADWQAELNPQILEAYLRVSQKIDKNPYDEWGLIHWPEIKPKKIGDKIHLVLKKFGNPLHYQEIAQRIAGQKFDHKQAHAPTVHNELIASDKYVLIGRGLYALKEWGYASGVVADVIENILKNALKPLSRDEIINQVLKQRKVKKNTVVLALAKDSRFNEKAGKYSLV